MGMGKMSASWVSLFLKDSQKGNAFCKAIVAKFDEGKNHFIPKYLTENGTWAHYSEPEMK